MKFTSFADAKTAIEMPMILPSATAISTGVAVKDWINELCAICFDVMEEHDKIYSCKITCGKSLHTQCFIHWKEYQQQKARGEHDDRMERQRARNEIDKKGIDRSGKDVAHVKALSKGGSNKDGVRLESPHKTRSYPRQSNHKPK